MIVTSYQLKWLKLISYNIFDIKYNGSHKYSFVTQNIKE